VNSTSRSTCRKPYNSAESVHGLACPTRAKASISLTHGLRQFLERTGGSSSAIKKAYFKSPSRKFEDSFRVLLGIPTDKSVLRLATAVMDRLAHDIRSQEDKPRDMHRIIAPTGKKALPTPAHTLSSRAVDRPSRHCHTPAIHRVPDDKRATV
jgi:hypothetical protein